MANLSRRGRKIAELIALRPELSKPEIGELAGFKGDENSRRGRVNYWLKKREVHQEIRRVRSEYLPEITKESVAFQLWEVASIPIEANTYNATARIGACRELIKLFALAPEQDLNLNLQGVPEEFLIKLPE